MDDDYFEDILLYETLKSHMKIISKFGVFSPLSSTVSYVWKLLRIYLLKPEVVIAGLLVLMFVIYLQATGTWNRGLLGKITRTFGFSRKSGKLGLLAVSAAEKNSWEEKKDVCAVYAVQGRRPRMEDR